MDDKTNRGPQDRVRIDIHEDYEVEYWTDKFGCTREQLAAAVAKAGTSASAVEAALKGRCNGSEKGRCA